MPTHPTTTTKPLCSISDLLGPPRKWAHYSRDPNAPFPRPALCGYTCTRPAGPEARANICPDCLRILNQGR